MTTKIDDLHPGDDWAYRTSTSSTVFHEARVLSVGTSKPSKVRIELVGDEWQGERRWVAPSRLEVRWEERPPHLERERQLRTVSRWHPSRNDRRAAERIFIELIPLDVAEFNADSAGTSIIRDLTAASHLLGIDAAELAAEPAFLDDDALIVPWPTTERMGRAAAAGRPEGLIHSIEMEEREALEHATFGETITSLVDGKDYRLLPTESRELFERTRMPELNRLRDWIGAERASEVLERQQLAEKLVLTAAIAQRALDALEPSQKRIVAGLRRELASAIEGVVSWPRSQ